MGERYRTHVEDLRQTRRGVLITATGVILAALAIRLLISGSRIPIEGRLTAVLSIATFAVAIVLSLRVHERTWILWLFPIALLLPLLAITSGNGQAQWIPLNLLITSAGALSALLVPTRLAVAISGLAAGLLLILWVSRPNSVVPLGVGVAGGWVAALACAVAVLTMAWAWQALHQRAERLDATQLQRVRQATSVLEKQERSTAWRTTALRIHESLLNCIRHVLSGGSLDRQALQVELSPFTAEGYLWESDTPASVGTLFRQVAADLRQHPAVRFRIQDDEFDLQAGALRGIRPALVEAARNAIHHGRATDVIVSARLEGDQMHFTVDDNGSGISATARPGLGSTEVLARSINEIGGQWQWQARPDGGISVLVTAPLTAGRSSGEVAGRVNPARFSNARFNPGRILITSPIAGAVVGGLLFMPYLASTGGLIAVLIALLGIALCCTVAFVEIRWRPLHGVWALAAMAIPLSLTLLASLLDSTCSNVNELAAVVNTAGLAVVVLAAWTKWPVAVTSLVGWGAGALLLYSNVPAVCGQPLHLALINVLFVFPMMILGTSVGARALARTRLREERIAALETRALARMSASRDITLRLQASVDTAVALLQEIANGAALDTRRRIMLECLDARIRVEIQVDPTQSGAFGLLARELVHGGSDVDVPVDVRAVQSSGDLRPLPVELVEILRSVITASHGNATLHAVTDGEEDHLSISMPVRCLAIVGLETGQSRMFDDVTLWVEEADGAEKSGSERVAVVVSRTIRQERAHLSLATQGS